ncbi:DUF3592 domain-containing protein [Actinoplanes sp. NPDC049668]|uniref:DUF3592 domain-containing protein n=1 Tax=unclassified Actinoplanes TaxID=2626549 RepID=UPI00339F3734
MSHAGCSLPVVLPDLVGAPGGHRLELRPHIIDVSVEDLDVGPAVGVDQVSYLEAVKVVDVVAVLVLVTVGAGILGLGLELRSEQSPYADGVVTTATTTSFHTTRTANRRRTVWTTHYRPVYTFETRAGETRMFADPITVREPPRLGRTVELSYRADEPGRARVIRGWHGWTGFPIIFTAAGALVLGSVVFLLGRSLIWELADRRSR